MLKSMKMVKVLSQLTEEYPHGCNVGKFSSDRTIQDYVDEIWHLDHITVDK